MAKDHERTVANQQESNPKHPPYPVVEGHLLRVRDEALRDEAVLPLPHLDQGLIQFNYWGVYI